jgi:hypothetical protein
MRKELAASELKSTGSRVKVFTKYKMEITITVGNKARRNSVLTLYRCFLNMKGKEKK